MGEIWKEIKGALPPSAKWIALAIIVIFAFAIYFSITLFKTELAANCIEQEEESAIKIAYSVAGK